jgi:DNA adenine methylase
VEPFVGGGSVALAFAAQTTPTRLVLSDADPGIYALWWCLAHDPDALVNAVRRRHVVGVEDYVAARCADGDLTLGPVECALAKLVLHQTTYSGLGYVSGGPIGGARQDLAKYKVDCRWRPDALAKKLASAAAALGRHEVEVLNTDAVDVVAVCEAGDVVYLDPPYVGVGEQLYRYGFGDGHGRLAGVLRGCHASWLLSYDDHPAVRELYAWADVREVENWSSITVPRSGEAKRPKELLISSLTSLPNSG